VFVIDGKIVRRIPLPPGNTLAWLYSSLGNRSGNQKALFRVEIEPLGFHSTKYFKCELLFASPSLSCRSVWLFALFKMAFKKISQGVEHLQNLN
jgi:hypothetical protein